MKKMKVSMKRDDWYAAAAIIVICAGFLAIGYVLGMINGQVLLIQTIVIPRRDVTENGAVTAVAAYYSDTESWQTDVRKDANISISHPIDFPTDDIYGAQSVDWRLNSGNENGTKILTISIPSTFQPQSNFGAASLTVGKSGRAKAVADCLKVDESTGEVAASSTKTINGVEYFVTHTSDVGAGNLYESTSYRTVKGGSCYAVEYTIHSSQLGNYPESYHLHEFDKAVVKGVLERIVETVAFLK